TLAPDVETLGGYILTQLAEVPVPGDIVTAAGYRFRVLEVRDRRIRRLRGEPLPAPPVDPDKSEDDDA
ncbi:MAG TPA: transporter associated domain-containing protein, partial [Polyangia bacterium]